MILNLAPIVVGGFEATSAPTQAECVFMLASYAHIAEWRGIPRGATVNTP
jgi:hypothetical protein